MYFQSDVAVPSPATGQQQMRDDAQPSANPGENKTSILQDSVASNILYSLELELPVITV